jgi:hypothetical protein
MIKLRFVSEEDHLSRERRVVDTLVIDSERDDLLDVVVNFRIRRRGWGRHRIRSPSCKKDDEDNDSN